MHGNENFRLLAEHEHGYIGICECCREFNVAYKNMLISFQEEEMMQFFDWIHANQFNPAHYMRLAHGRNRIFTSPHSNLYMVFTDEEIVELLEMFGQVKLVLEAEKILLSNRMN
jgi:hypothetical protein